MINYVTLCGFMYWHGETSMHMLWRLFLLQSVDQESGLFSLPGVTALKSVDCFCYLGDRMTYGPTCSNCRKEG